MANNVGVRDYLQNQGVQSGDIGYDQGSGNVTVRGQNFIRPAANLAGTTYDSQQNLDSAYGNYKKSLPVIQPGGTVGTMGDQGNQTVTANPTVTKAASDTPAKTGNGGYSNPYTQTIADIIKHLTDSSNAAPADVYSSPQYAAAQAAQQRQSQQAIRHANESAAGAGLGHSTIMTDRSQGIENDSNNYLATQLVPQIQSQLQAQRQTELANERAHLNDIIGLSDRSDNQHNADRTYEAGRQDAATTATGIFNPSGKSVQEVQAQMDANSKAYAAATPEEKDKLHTENMQLAGLLGKTFDPNSGTYSEGQGFVGTKTVAQKQLDLNNVKDMAVLTGRMPDGTLTNAAQQQALTNEWTASEKLGTITPALAHLYGLPPGTKTEAAKEHAANLAISQQNADTSSANGKATRDNLSADNTRADNAAKQNHLMDIWKATGKAPAGIEGVPVDTPYGQTPKYSTVEEFAKYVETTPLISNVGGIKTVTDPIALEKAILSSGMTPQEMTKAYNAYKIPLKK